MTFTRDSLSQNHIGLPLYGESDFIEEIWIILFLNSHDGARSAVINISVSNTAMLDSDSFAVRWHDEGK